MKCPTCDAWMPGSRCAFCEAPMLTSTVATLLGAKFYGTDKSAIGFTAANRARPINLTFCTDPTNLKNTRSEIVISVVGAHHLSQPGQTVIEVENPKAAFARVLRSKVQNTGPRIHPTAIIDTRYVKFGSNITVKPYAVIGYDGFGFEPDGLGYELFPHIGGVVIEDNVSIGSFTVIDRGKLDDTVIGAGTKLDNRIHVAHGVKLGKNCLVVAQTIIGGSTVIGDRVYISMGAVIRDHLSIGERAFIGMGAVVTKDVEPGVTVVGNPAKPYQRRNNDG